MMSLQFLLDNFYSTVMGFKTNKNKQTNQKPLDISKMMSKQLIKLIV